MPGRRTGRKGPQSGPGDVGGEAENEGTLRAPFATQGRSCTPKEVLIGSVLLHPDPTRLQPLNFDALRHCTKGSDDNIAPWLIVVRAIQHVVATAVVSTQRRCGHRQRLLIAVQQHGHLRAHPQPNAQRDRVWLSIQSNQQIEPGALPFLGPGLLTNRDDPAVERVPSKPIPAYLHEHPLVDLMQIALLQCGAHL